MTIPMMNRNIAIKSQKEKDPPLMFHHRKKLPGSIDELKSEQKNDPFILEVTNFLKKEIVVQI